MFTGLAEAHLDVSDLEESIDFYETLGMDVAWRDEEVAFDWVGDPDGNRLEFLAQLPDGVDEDRDEKLSLEEWEAERGE